ncbi:DUF3667 domain-containing protein [Ferruginibacter sp.]
MENITYCKNCSQQLTGKFCSNCGEKVYTNHDKNIGHFFEEGFHFITHFDGKFFTTLKTVITKPGQLSLDYCNGVRKKYFKPLSFFLVVVVLYLLFPKFQGLNMAFSTYVNKEYKYAAYALPIAKNKIAVQKISGNELAEHYNARSEKFAKPFLLILLPFSAILLWILFFKRKLFFDHFVLGVELNAILICIQFLIAPLLYTISTAIYSPAANFFADDNLSPFFIIETSLLLFIIVKATKKFYNQNWWWTISKSVLFLSLYMFIIIDIYKMLLYFSIMLFL